MAYKFGEKTQLVNELIIATDEKTGFKYRPDTLDIDVLKELREYKAIFEVCEGHTVMDIGANIGMFTFLSLKAGAKRVISYEPEPENFLVLSEQELDPTRVILNNVAVTDSNGETKFYITERKPNKKQCMGRHSIIPTKGRKEITVKTVDFYDEFKKYKPTIIKCDTEGGEYTIDWTKLPKSVQYFAIEIHCIKNEEKAEQLLAWFDSEFETLYKLDTKYFGKKDTYVRAGKRRGI